MTSLTLLRDLWSAGPAVDRLTEAQVRTPDRQRPHPNATASNLSNVSTTKKIHSNYQAKVWRSWQPKPTKFPAIFYATPRLLYH
ncbi:MAG: hypothetical protein JGK17_19140 [Microcoleus sp. PH2017_10_PVI_O_A]|uniref:hypothetical protein n=1 Tax=unclassified Microcoleus TaxID=2642155 RepID=UPI001E02C425|nr:MULTISPECIES: hypothetical protein [unclassified Microcoleus]TAE80332.1 MAG: hypothetical protein EAZ83_18690 [Oscillatoriales cyanobacterium]MCC3407667.1 hypothetical protein [Microcoleus sp. PH2017_10_PVI_O_A]MCC3461873.1 hypothetical protein [Microcoleus sp. PH2017_11_PCY_U_A]MCC3480260.1 hypothetical protein [Microcoleus sp. PH2017_12_PCY_D_A]MCC3527590.1 hypothetical protein [Microcoleus sp. PH2017_21_RUC_O_A]